MNKTDIISWIYEAETSCFSPHWSKDAIKSELEKPGCVCVIQEQDGVFYGFALGEIISGEAELYRIAVLEQYRNKGIGEALLQRFIQKCNGCSRIFLEVRKKNLPAASLYEKLGFRKIGLRKGYYGDDDAVLYALEL